MYLKKFKLIQEKFINRWIIGKKKDLSKLLTEVFFLNFKLLVTSFYDQDSFFAIRFRSFSSK